VLGDAFYFQDSVGGRDDRPSGWDAEAHCDAASGTITALDQGNSGGVPAGFVAYYVVRTDARISGFEVKELKDRRVAWCVLPRKREAVMLRVGTSFVSFEQAARNLDGEVGEEPFEAGETRGGYSLGEALGRIRIQGGSETQRKIFYSGLTERCCFRAFGMNGTRKESLFIGARLVARSSRGSCTRTTDTGTFIAPGIR